MERNGLEQKRHATIRNLEASNNESDRDFDRCHGYIRIDTVKHLKFRRVNDETTILICFY